MDASPIGFQSKVLKKKKSKVLWESIPQVEVLKVQVQDIGSKHFAPQGEAGNCAFPLDCMVLGLEFLEKVCLSLFYPFLCGYFLVNPMCRSHFVTETTHGGPRYCYQNKPLPPGSFCSRLVLPTAR